MPLKVLIVDDEPGMRLVIEKTVEKLKGFEVIGGAASTEEALKLFYAQRPQVVFLDIELQGSSGVECAEEMLSINPKTMVIFATGHNEYMPRAFELYAFDYIIKPFKIERILNTLNRIKDITEEKREVKVIEKSKASIALDKLAIKNKEGITLIDPSEIILIQREEKSTVIYTSNERISTSDSLGDIQEKLDMTKFMRSHKSYIINVSKINKIYPYGRWTYVVKFKDTEMDALLTHENYSELKDIFNL
ncbi:LytR/AlgR family response regulator transcription factor [Alloiococcus sp. CFN-8]|uniref:LytR/AlgR family response regulator transcription factor n=1 Tax=Alloiococcus sp. CFN-8 TaxID=3416081 RepID=UPI003CF34E01